MLLIKHGGEEVYYVQDGVPADAVAAGGELEAMAEVIWGGVLN